MQQHWILIDTQRNQHVESWHLAGESLGWPELQLQFQRLRGGQRDGVEMLTVQIGSASWHLLPTRGMGLWAAEVDGCRFGWQSPTPGPVHPRWVPLSEPSGLGWLSGFDELLVRCGLTSNGAPDFDAAGRLQHGLHGQIANLPAHRLDVLVDPETRSLEVIGSVDEVRFHFSKLRLTSRYRWEGQGSSVQVVDRIENLSASPAEAQLLYHINVGTPVLATNARVHVPARRMVPRTPHAAQGSSDWQTFPAPTPGFAEQVYFFDVLANDQQRSLALLHDAELNRGVCVRYNREQLPCFSLWKNPAAIEDGYVTGIEPATNFPNPRSFEAQQGRVIALPPRGDFETELQLELLTERASLQSRLTEIEELQAREPLEVADGPTPDWCAD